MCSRSMAGIGSSLIQTAQSVVATAVE